MHAWAHGCAWILECRGGRYGSRQGMECRERCGREGRWICKGLWVERGDRIRGRWDGNGGRWGEFWVVDPGGEVYVVLRAVDLVLLLVVVVDGLDVVLRVWVPVELRLVLGVEVVEVKEEIVKGRDRHGGSLERELHGSLGS